jgi:hypothetical protein
MTATDHYDIVTLGKLHWAPQVLTGRGMVIIFSPNPGKWGADYTD